MEWCILNLGKLIYTNCLIICKKNFTRFMTSIILFMIELTTVVFCFLNKLIQIKYYEVSHFNYNSFDFNIE